MSIKIGTSGSARTVTDMVVGTTSSKKNINVVKDWNGNIIWQRATPMTPENTVITIDPTYYSWSGTSYTKSYTAQPSVTRVKVNGTSLSSSQYSISYSANSTGTLYGTSSVTASVTVTGKNGYSGSVSKEYKVSYTYSEPHYYYYVAFNGNGHSGGETMATQTIERDVSTKLTTNAFTNAGKVFNGWAESSSGSVVYTDGQSVLNLASTNATKDLYAVWGDPPSVESFTITKTRHTASNNPLTTQWYVYLGTSFYGEITVNFSNGTNAVLYATKGDYNEDGLTYTAAAGVQYEDTFTYLDGEKVTIPSGKSKAYAVVGRVHVKSNGTKYPECDITQSVRFVVYI